jgi:hypothetical protein
MSIQVDDIARPRPTFDRYKRYILPNRDGKEVSHRRVSTVAKAIDDRYNLEKWAQRMVAHGIGLRDDLHSLAASHKPDEDRQVLDDVCLKAFEAAKGSAAASEGTALHRFTERIDRGQIELTDIGKRWRPLIALYRRTLDKEGITVVPEFVEQIIIDDSQTVAGQLDRVALLDRAGYVGDLKTGKNLEWSWLSIAIQLAAYANHTAIWNGQRGPRIELETGIALVIHLPATGPECGTCTIYTLDIEKGYDAYLTACEVLGHRTEKSKLAKKLTDAKLPKPTAVFAMPGEKPRKTIVETARAMMDLHSPPPANADPLERAWLVERIRGINAEAGANGLRDFANVWPETVPRPMPQTLTVEQFTALDEMIALIEAKYAIPFVPYEQ